MNSAVRSVIIASSVVVAGISGCISTEPDVGVADDFSPTQRGLISVPKVSDPKSRSCGGFGGLECPDGLTCVDDPDDNCDPTNGGADCPGVCVPPMCGGIGSIPCADGLLCVDDPTDDCDPANGGADCGGICVARTCGGFGNLPCPDGYECADDASDDCDPNQGGADCAGVCVALQAP